MSMTTVQQILSDPSLVPWIEERAFDYSMHRFVMAQRVLTKTDLKGWVSRKVSEVLRPLGAKLLEEGVDIPASKHYRKRLAEIEPQEWGDKYPVTNRRIDTDPEDVLADVVAALGYSLGRKREQQLFASAISDAPMVISKPSSPYDLNMAVHMQTEFEAKAFDGQLYHVIHPFQEMAVKVELLKLTNAAVPEFRNRFIRDWSYGGFGGLNIAVSSMTPRKVTKRLVMTNALENETFRLRFGLQDTDDIEVGADAATTLANILAALNALDGYGGSGTTFTGTQTGLDDIQITSPVFVDEENQLELGRDANGDVVDNVTGGITVQEVSGIARAPFFEREAIIHDIRDAVVVYSEWFPSRRTLEIGAYETYGVGIWRGERRGYIETDATSPLAVP